MSILKLSEFKELNGKKQDITFSNNFGNKISNIFLIRSKLEKYGIAKLIDKSDLYKTNSHKKIIDFVRPECQYYYLGNGKGICVEDIIHLVDLLESINVDYIYIDRKTLNMISGAYESIKIISEKFGIEILEDLFISPFNRHIADLGGIEVHEAIYAFLRNDFLYDRKNGLRIMQENIQIIKESICINFGLTEHVVECLIAKTIQESRIKGIELSNYCKKNIKNMYKLCIKLNNYIVNNNQKPGISVLMMDDRLSKSFIKENNNSAKYPDFLLSKIVSKIKKLKNSSIRRQEEPYEKIEICFYLGLTDLRNTMISKDSFYENKTVFELEKEKKVLREKIVEYDKCNPGLLGIYFEYLLKIDDLQELEMWIKEFFEIDMYGLVEIIEILITEKIDKYVASKNFNKAIELVDLMRKYNFETRKILYDEIYGLKLEGKN